MLEPFAGRYRVIGELSSGANATVHLALDPGGREVVIKRLRPERALSPGWVERMRREARTIASIRHVGVVRAIELGQARDGTPYLVMERLHGTTLARTRDHAGRLDQVRACSLVAALLDALDAVHGHGIVHRDVKPENVLVTSLEDDERPVLLDFGIARLIDERLAQTGTGAMAGTPLYMSPEQARGVPDLDVRVDVWAAGAILYELLTGRTPFEGKTAMQVMHAVITQPALAPSALEPSIDPRLDEIVLRSLAKQPAQRYPSAAAMRDALLSVVEQHRRPSGTHSRATPRDRARSGS